jgi:hypothetical protein
LDKAKQTEENLKTKTNKYESEASISCKGDIYRQQIYQKRNLTLPIHSDNTFQQYETKLRTLRDSTNASKETEAKVLLSVKSTSDAVLLCQYALP